MQNEERNYNHKKRMGDLLDTVNFHIEIDKRYGQMSIVINGTDSILEYSDKSILLRTGKQKVKINGDALTLALYENKAVEVIGKIMEIDFYD